jgi:hypothetical protein
MSTGVVFLIARRALRVDRRATAARYSLQRALLELGPSGFPFEQFIAEMLRHEGYRIRTGVVLQGRYVRHEVDVDARRGRERVLAECKFRGKSDGKVDIKIALYVHARAEDLDVLRYQRFLLVTNGRFTRDALRYGDGVGLDLLSWDHPTGSGLRDRIDRAGLHPVTALTALRKQEQQSLIRERIVLCADLLARPKLVDRLRLGARRQQQLWREVEGLCDPGRGG